MLHQGHLSNDVWLSLQDIGIRLILPFDILPIELNDLLPLI